MLIDFIINHRVFLLYEISGIYYKQSWLSGIIFNFLNRNTVVSVYFHRMVLSLTQGYYNYLSHGIF